jgi:hypothetical protein
LRNQRHASRQRLHRSQRDIQSKIGADDTKCRGTEKANTVFRGHRQNFALPLARGDRRVRRGGQDHRCLQSRRAAFRENTGDVLARRGNHGELHRLFERGERARRRVTQHLPVVRIDREDLAAKTSGEHIFVDDAAERSRPLRGSDQCHR